MSAISQLNAYQQYNPTPSFLETEKISSVQKGKDNFVEPKNNSQDFGEIEDKAIISNRAYALYESEEANNSLNKKEQEDNAQKNIMNDAKQELNQSEKQQVAKLQEIDTKVKAHEQAHKAAAGGLNTSAANYEYEVGPDGRKYAVAGEVSISYNQSSNPEKNIENAKKLKEAALAPADPSSTDRAVARDADARIADAQKEIEKLRFEQKENNDNSDEITQSNDNSQDNSVQQDTKNLNAEPKQDENLSFIPVNTAESIINPAANAILINN